MFHRKRTKPEKKTIDQGIVWIKIPRNTKQFLNIISLVYFISVIKKKKFLMITSTFSIENSEYIQNVHHHHHYHPWWWFVVHKYARGHHSCQRHIHSFIHSILLQWKQEKKTFFHNHILTDDDDDHHHQSKMLFKKNRKMKQFPPISKKSGYFSFSGWKKKIYSLWTKVQWWYIINFIQTTK